MGGEVGREDLVGLAGQAEPREGVDGDGQEQVEELQCGVEAIAVGVVPEDLSPEQVADQQEDQVLEVRAPTRAVSVRLYQLVRWLIGITTAYRTKATAGWPKNLATGLRNASVTARWAVPEVPLQANCSGEAMAYSGAATMIRNRCWTMWSQKSSPS